ncbi:MAG: Lipoprotein-releasing system ATP-binding protein LolD [Bacteroidota bacterium]|jgi:lipoprotein-releasing system ATP-binding protein
MSQPIIEVKNVFKSYGDLPVLKGVSMSVNKGEVISIVGASGAGKSTLMHIIGTLDQADKGQVIIDDKDLSGLRGKALSDFRNKHIGFVFQFHQLLPEFTAIENVLMPAWIAGEKESTADQRAKDLLKRMGLLDRIHHKPSELSGGEQQRVAIARALINNPAIILADEPSGNLDSNNAKQLHQLFFELRNEMNQTFVIVTHNNELADMADRKLTIKDGII